MAIGSFGNTLESDALKKEFSATDYTPPATHYVGLSSTAVLDDASGITEPSTGSYAGQSYTNNGTNWATSGTNPTVAQNQTAISFPQATAPGWGAAVRYWFLKRTNGAGALVAWGQLVGSYQDVTSVDTTGDTLTVPSHGYVANTPVLVDVQGGSVPGGLAVDTTYYIKSPATNTFQLSATIGGAAIDITSIGSGRIRVAEDKSQVVTNGTTLTLPINGIQVQLD